MHQESQAHGCCQHGGWNAGFLKYIYYNSATLLQTETAKEKINNAEKSLEVAREYIFNINLNCDYIAQSVC